MQVINSEKEITMLKCELKTIKIKYDKLAGDYVKTMKERDSYKEQLATMGEMNQELENELKLTRNQNSELRNIIDSLHDDIFELKKMNNGELITIPGVLSSDKEELKRKQAECLSQINCIEIRGHNGKVLSYDTTHNGEIKILNDILEDEPIPRIARRGRPSNLTAEQRKQNVHNSQIEYHRKRYQDDEEYRERLKQRGRDKYKELKSNKPLKDLTVEEQKVLKKAYNDKYREKKKLFEAIHVTKKRNSKMYT